MVKGIGTRNFLRDEERIEWSCYYDTIQESLQTLAQDPEYYRECCKYPSKITAPPFPQEEVDDFVAFMKSSPSKKEINTYLKGRDSSRVLDFMPFIRAIHEIGYRREATRCYHMGLFLVHEDCYFTRKDNPLKLCTCGKYRVKVRLMPEVPKDFRLDDKTVKVDITLRTNPYWEHWTPRYFDGLRRFLFDWGF